jgi:pilus assembly protein CpaF
MSLEAGLVARVRGRLALDAGEPTRARVAAAVRDELGVRGDADVLAMAESLRGELLGAGPLEPLLREPGVTDVLVNGPNQVWVDRGRGLEPAGVRFADDRAVRRLAVRLAAAAGRRLDDAMPCADVRLADGTRLHAVLPPIAPAGACLSFRIPRRRPFTLLELVEAGTVPAPAADLIDSVVRARLSFLVTGGTGSGKTTVLATILGRAEPADRIVLIEDSGELNPDHPHVVRLEARTANVEGAGAIGLRALVREALRMRPDRLIVGEVRGAECVDLLAALNVGHDGGAGTLHANSATDVPARVEALCAGAGLGREAVHSQLAAGVQAIIHLRRDRDGSRQLAAIGILERGSAGSGHGLVVVRPAWFDDHGEWVAGPGRDVLDAMLSERR